MNRSVFKIHNPKSQSEAEIPTSHRGAFHNSYSLPFGSPLNARLRQSALAVLQKTSIDIRGTVAFRPQTPFHKRMVWTLKGPAQRSSTEQVLARSILRIPNSAFRIWLSSNCLKTP